jgi:hypothetical protein
MDQNREPSTDVVGLTAPRGSALMRASTDDRKRVTDWLQAQYVAGRLNSTELEERIEQALEARTMGDLDALTADLPPMTPPATSIPETGSRREQRERRERGRHHRGQRGSGTKQGFAAHATSYVLVMALLVAIWLLTSPHGHFWPIWPMLGWGIGLASHGLAVLRHGSDGADTADGMSPRAVGC